MKKIECWGIFRETTHSPDRESDDENILCLTAKKLENQGVNVSLFRPDEIRKRQGAATKRSCRSGELTEKTYSKKKILQSNSIKHGITRPGLVFLMCETLPILDVLNTWEQQGVVMINPIEGVRNTYRYRTVELLSGELKFFPESVLIETADTMIEQKMEQCWVKRGDVHATQEGDVVFAQNAQELTQCLKRLNKRGIKEAVLQKHIEGDLIKFYGIGNGEGNWFHWFYHKNQVLKNYPFNSEVLKDYALKSAGILGLEIFGGDAIVEPSGRIHIIDLNAWPSFALFRDEASTRISNYIISKTQNQVRRSQLTAVER